MFKWSLMCTNSVIKEGERVMSSHSHRWTFKQKSIKSQLSQAVTHVFTGTLYRAASNAQKVTKQRRQLLSGAHETKLLKCSHVEENWCFHGSEFQCLRMWWIEKRIKTHVLHDGSNSGDINFVLPIQQTRETFNNLLAQKLCSPHPWKTSEHFWGETDLTLRA